MALCVFDRIAERHAVVFDGDDVRGAEFRCGHRKNSTTATEVEDPPGLIPLQRGKVSQKTQASRCGRMGSRPESQLRRKTENHPVRIVPLDLIQEIRFGCFGHHDLIPDPENGPGFGGLGRLPRFRFDFGNAAAEFFFQLFGSLPGLLKAGKLPAFAADQHFSGENDIFHDQLGFPIVELVFGHIFGPSVKRFHG